MGILLAVNYLHKLNIAHRDLHPNNIMFETEGSQNVKIIDFGISSEFTKEKGMEGEWGTSGYMAPEIFSKKPYNEKIDVWAIGCIAYELFTKKYMLNKQE